ncbi:hypothetical protein [Undibacterium parvum]|uniref:Uncharacterized protein n=1 Tax=Undibacterium parvum TaxID=401471 RepID=A0A3Q9BQI0_9BURK|nr:hypothetical protein [Undibacterium parvum]AZP12183.1 hypothetical protein EJN92_09300 [Undibacterium parvum]
MKRENSDEQKIQTALENPKFMWRTISGISNETKVSTDTVRKVIVSKGDRVVMSSVPNTKGESLFASREKHRQQTSPFKRLISAFKNRGD